MELKSLYIFNFLIFFVFESRNDMWKTHENKLRTKKKREVEPRNENKNKTEKKKQNKNRRG